MKYLFAMLDPFSKVEVREDVTPSPRIVTYEVEAPDGEQAYAQLQAELQAMLDPALEQ